MWLATLIPQSALLSLWACSIAFARSQMPTLPARPIVVEPNPTNATSPPSELSSMYNFCMTSARAYVEKQRHAEQNATQTEILHSKTVCGTHRLMTSPSSDFECISDHLSALASHCVARAATSRKVRTERAGFWGMSIHPRAWRTLCFRTRGTRLGKNVSRIVACLLCWDIFGVSVGGRVVRHRCPSSDQGRR